MIVNRKHREGERGDVLVLCAIFMVVLLLFVGLAIDFGLAYVTKARLGKAVDAASLTCARYSAQGTAASTALAQSTFTMNYGSSPVPPVVNFAFSSDASGNTYVSVNATATINTVFIGMLPAFRTLSVTAAAQSEASRVVMTLVLDRTGSMADDGGQAALPSSVTDFIGYFNNVNDNVALVSFANDVTVDVPMTTGSFQSPIISAVNSMNFAGATWSEGALQQALATENSFPMPPVPLQKVVVFFTDGNANTIQDNLTCTGGVGSGTWNFGGYDTPSDGIGFLTPNTNPTYPRCEETDSSCCPGPSNSPGKFNSHVAGGPVDINWTNVSGPAGDARYRSLEIANQMRASSITVYAIGLGTATEAVDPGFVCQLANDPSTTCSQYFTYNPSLPTGVSQYVSTGSDLDSAFQTIASIIRLRLTK